MMVFEGRYGGWSCGQGFGRFGRELESVKCDLGGVEELAAFFGRNSTDEDAVGSAGDEVADAFITDRQRHGVAVGVARVLGRKDFVESFACGIPVVRFEGALPGGTATLEGGFGVGGIGAGSGGERSGRRNV